MKDILTQLSNKYKCDKSDKRHNYTTHYNRLFEKYRNDKFNMVEFGFGLGKSVKMWLEYFTNVKLITVDIRKPPTDDRLISDYIKAGRLDYVNTTQINIKTLEPIIKETEPFLIIDDASHVVEDQQFTMGFAFMHLQKGGWYIIEDLKCKRSHNKIFGIEADNTLRVLNNFAITGNFNSKVLTPEQNEYISKNIEQIEIIDKIAFIKKKE